MVVGPERPLQVRGSGAIDAARRVVGDRDSRLLTQIGPSRGPVKPCFLIAPRIEEDDAANRRRANAQDFDKVQRSKKVHFLAPGDWRIPY